MVFLDRLYRITRLLSKKNLNCSVGEGAVCLSETDDAFGQGAWNCETSLECLENVDEMFHAAEVRGFQFADHTIDASIPQSYNGFYKIRRYLLTLFYNYGVLDRRILYGFITGVHQKFSEKLVLG